MNSLQRFQIYQNKESNNLKPIFCWAFKTKNWAWKIQDLYNCQANWI